MSPEQFKQIRQSLGWSLKDCSQHILMGERHIRRMEDGTRVIQPYTAQLMTMFNNQGK